MVVLGIILDGRVRSFRGWTNLNCGEVASLNEFLILNRSNYTCGQRSQS